MLTKDYYFDLPSELIAQEPSERRGADRLLLLDRARGCYEDHMMEDFPSLLHKDSVIVVNSSKVRKARVYGRAETGGLVEFLFLSPNADGSWKCMVKKAKKQRKSNIPTLVPAITGPGPPPAAPTSAITASWRSISSRRSSWANPSSE